uniref:Uncharacterized protein n=1 Tax=Octopus bimaculoides TaxID=37653 RepID=A0A0L8GI81_OCTBM
MPFCTLHLLALQLLRNSEPPEVKAIVLRRYTLPMNGSYQIRNDLGQKEATHPDLHEEVSKPSLPLVKIADNSH